MTSLEYIITDKKDGERVVVLEDNFGNIYYVTNFLTFGLLKAVKKQDDFKIVNIYDGELMKVNAKKHVILFDYIYGEN